MLGIFNFSIGMSDPAIIVIPVEYYGGAFPKVARPKGSPLQSGMSPGKTAARKFSPKIVFIVGVSILFIAVVGFAAWYFTKPLRVSNVQQSPAVVASEPAATPVTPEAPTPPATPQPASSPSSQEPAPPQKTEETPVAPEQFSDSDNDKLTFAEEELYHTQATTPDTDSDSFLDGHEVVNLYNPSGIAPEKLEAAGLVARAVNTTYGYEVLYPNAWQSPKDLAAREMDFSANGDAITVSVLDNPGSVSLTDWAVQNFGGTFSAWTSNKAGLTGLFGQTPTGLHAAFSGRGFIYLFEYAPGSVEHPIYTTTFEMMLNSFRIIEHGT